MNLADRILDRLASKFQPPVSEQDHCMNDKLPLSGWVVFVLNATSKAMDDPKWHKLVGDGHIKYDVDVVRAIQDEMTQRVNVCPDEPVVFSWLYSAQGHIDYATKLAQSCYEFEFQHAIKEQP